MSPVSKQQSKIPTFSLHYSILKGKVQTQFQCRQTAQHDEEEHIETMVNFDSLREWM